MIESGRRKSKIWSYFAVKEDVHYTECNKYKEQISGGGQKHKKTFSRTKLVQHLLKHKMSSRNTRKKRIQMHLKNHRHQSNYYSKKQRIDYDHGILMILVLNE